MENALKVDCKALYYEKITSENKSFALGLSLHVMLEQSFVWVDYNWNVLALIALIIISN